MFKVTITSLIGLMLVCSQAYATTPFLCSNCGSPYTDSGRQTYANYAHNLAWGSKPIRLIQNGYGSPSDASFNYGAWDTKIMNRFGESITIRYRPSMWQIVQKTFGLGASRISSFTLILPNKQIVPVRVVYAPGKNHAIVNLDDLYGRLSGTEIYLHTSEAYFNGPGWNNWQSLNGFGRSIDQINEDIPWDDCSNCDSQPYP